MLLLVLAFLATAVANFFAERAIVASPLDGQMDDPTIPRGRVVNNVVADHAARDETRKRNSQRQTIVSSMVESQITDAHLLWRPQTCQSTNAGVQPPGQKYDEVINIYDREMFWWGAQERLCEKLRTSLGVKAINDIEMHPEKYDAMKNVLLNATVNCTLLGRDDGLGTGNWVLGMYMTRIVAASANIDMEFHCSDGDYRHDVLTWLQGCYPITPLQERIGPIDEERLCVGEMRRVPVYRAAYDIRRDMRNLVTKGLDVHQATEVGGRSPGGNPGSSPLDKWLPPPVETNRHYDTELFGSVFLDDATIHFRCGDVLKLKNPRGDYGFTRFVEYAKRISPTTRSIGIVTQPFEAAQNREQDANNTDKCKMIVTSLQTYLQNHYPTATVSIRNGPGETLVLAYLRIAAANETMTSLSSFSAFPLLANYGESHYEHGRLLVNQWLHEVTFEHTTPIQGDFMKNKRIMTVNVDFIIDWLTKY